MTTSHTAPALPTHKGLHFLLSVFTPPLTTHPHPVLALSVCVLSATPEREPYPLCLSPSANLFAPLDSLQSRSFSPPLKAFLPPPVPALVASFLRLELGFKENSPFLRLSFPCCIVFFLVSRVKTWEDPAADISFFSEIGTCSSSNKKRPSGRNLPNSFSRNFGKGPGVASPGFTNSFSFLPVAPPPLPFCRPCFSSVAPTRDRLGSPALFWS